MPGAGLAGAGTGAARAAAVRRRWRWMSWLRQRGSSAAQSKAAPDSPLASVRAATGRHGRGACGRAWAAMRDKPVELVGDALRGRIVRAHAAAARRAGLCRRVRRLPGAAMSRRMQSALAEGIARLAAASDSAKVVPVIDGVQTMKHNRCLPCIRAAGRWTLRWSVPTWSIPQCADPRVTATDAAGKALPAQPMLDRRGARADRAALARRRAHCRPAAWCCMWPPSTRCSCSAAGAARRPAR